ncbi:enoyl-CoA hydratase-related protein [Streptomyces sanyensis]|uniref:Enoyl-CoA hydratase n=1 Tax=Streptomyces sanyensis TaxID=568869 RepID=A0ABP9A0P4_9ACTN
MDLGGLEEAVGRPCRDVRVGYRGARLTVTLARPDRRNSLTPGTLQELGAALDLAERTEDCRLVVLEGSDGYFCTGMDLDDAAGSGQEDGTGPDLRAGAEAYYRLLDRLTRLGRMVVSHVDGQVVGGGVGLVAASDLVYATERSRFSLPEALWGLLPCSVLPFLIRRTGFQPAYTMALSTLPVTARQAAACRLVDEVLDDPGDVLRRLQFRASRVDPATVAALKDYARRLGTGGEDTERLAVDEFVTLMSDPRVRQRIRGFVTGPGAPPASPPRATGT